MKDPASLFYSSDFLTGTMLMTNEEIGKYIKLMCLQHQKGHLKEQEMLKICGQYSEEIFSKFTKDDNGLYFNKRLDKEIENRIKHKEKQRENGLKGGRPKNPNETQTKPKQKPLEIEIEIEIVNENINSNNYILLKDTLLTWFKYKREKNQYYLETGLKSLLTQIKNNVDKFGEEKVKEVILNSMANNYTGIIFSNLKEDKQLSKMERLMKEAEERDRKRANGEIE